MSKIIKTNKNSSKLDTGPEIDGLKSFLLSFTKFENFQTTNNLNHLQVFVYPGKQKHKRPYTRYIFENMRQQIELSKR